MKFCVEIDTITWHYKSGDSYKFDKTDKFDISYKLDISDNLDTPVHFSSCFCVGRDKLDKSYKSDKSC